AALLGRSDKWSRFWGGQRTLHLSRWNRGRVPRARAGRRVGERAIFLERRGDGFIRNSPRWRVVWCNSERLRSRGLGRLDNNHIRVGQGFAGANSFRGADRFDLGPLT